MSLALYDEIGGIRFWTPEEVRKRARIKEWIADTVERTLLDLNQQWRMLEVDAPLMMPRERMNAAYDNSDIFLLQDAPGGSKEWALRAETTNGTYVMAQHLIRSSSMNPPLCLYQAGKSFRRETTDGATAAKLRFNEFYQLEFQCIYGLSTTAPIPEALRKALLPVVAAITGLPTRLIESDRLPAYATETIDIEVLLPGEGKEEWREVASTSRRTDFPGVQGMKYECTVFEVAFGLDRMVSLAI